MIFGGKEGSRRTETSREYLLRAFPLTDRQVHVLEAELPVAVVAVARAVFLAVCSASSVILVAVVAWFLAWCWRLSF